MKKVKKTNKTMSVLIIAFSLILISLIGLTVAYFTDSKSYTGTLEFGNIELDITGGVDETTKVINFDIDRKTNNDPTWTGKIMPGDTIKMQVNIGLKSTSEPAYYVAVITDTKGAFENGIYFSDGTNVYVNDGTKTYLQSDSAKTALTGSNLKYVGALTKADTHNLTLNAVVSADYEIQGGKTEVELHIYAIQQANMDEYNETKQERSAYHQLMQKADYVINGVNSTSVADLKSVISNYANLTNFGIVKTRNVPAGYTLDESLTTKLNTETNPVLDDRSRGKISVYKKSDTELVLASDYKIVAPTDCTKMFNGFEKATTIDVSNLDTSNTTIMRGMFSMVVGSPKTVLTTIIGLDNFNTSKVTDMAGLFQACIKLTNLDGIQSWDTRNVVDMTAMFYYCQSVTTIDVCNFDTSNVTNMSQMFGNCEALTNLDVSNFNTANVTNMRLMFTFCKNLTNINVSNFNTSKVTNMQAMFQNCEKVTTLDVSNFDTSNITDMANFFRYCQTLTSLDVSSFDTSKVENMQQMFFNCSSLTSLNLSSFDTSKVTTWTSMLKGTFKTSESSTLTISDKFVYGATNSSVGSTQFTKAELVSKTSFNTSVKLMRGTTEVTA